MVQKPGPHLKNLPRKKRDGYQLKEVREVSEFPVKDYEEASLGKRKKAPEKEGEVLKCCQTRISL